jgi:Ca2+-binding RTX toxin-like protein
MQARASTSCTPEPLKDDDKEPYLMSRMTRAAVGAALLVAAVPAVAEANTVSLNQGLMSDVHTSQRSASVISEVVGNDVHIRSNDGITQILNPQCRRIDAQTAACPGGAVQRLTIQLGPGHDVFTSRTALDTLVIGFGGDDVYVGAAHNLRNRVEFIGRDGTDAAMYLSSTTGVRVTKDEQANDGRPGFDFDNIRGDVEKLVGSPHNDVLTGSNSSAPEYLDGNMGDDVLKGLGGPDVFLTQFQADGADQITGGPGVDTVDYSGRTRPITATLNFGGADDGEAGERDQLIGANERIIGGRAGDTIKAPAGSTASHQLEGGPGNDTIHGADGADTLIGGPGSDTLLAFGGSDTVLAADNESDTVGCGAGTDTAHVDNRDGHSSCENRPVGRLSVGPKAITAAAGKPARLQLSWRHPQAWRKLRTVTLRLTRDGVEVGAIEVRPRAGQISADGAVALARKQSRVGHRGKSVVARLALRIDGALAGATLKAHVEATDVNGTRQVEGNAATIRVRASKGGWL